MLKYNMPQTAARPSDLKRNNRIQILELFKTGTVYSVAEIARTIGISRQTVMKAIQFFLEKGVIESGGKAASGSMGGKRAELFSLSANRYLFSVLICPDGLYVSLFNFRCEVIDTFQQSGVAEMPVDEIVASAGRACHSLMDKNGIGRESVFGICISTPGIVDRASRCVKFNALFPNWGRDVALAEMLGAYFDRDLLILTENASKVCGSAYLHDKKGVGARVATLFSSWDGISSCQMAYGRILDGKDSLIGEIGHTMLNPDDPEDCACGSHGCFERQVSADRIRRWIQELSGRIPDSALLQKPLAQITIRDVFDASSAGDALAREVSGRVAAYFAQALHNLALIFNPDSVVFQGDCARADDFFREQIFHEMRRFKYYTDSADSPFALYMDDRSITELTTRGAYILLIDCLFSDETTYS